MKKGKPSSKSGKEKPSSKKAITSAKVKPIAKAKSSAKAKPAAKPAASGKPSKDKIIPKPSKKGKKGSFAEGQDDSSDKDWNASGEDDAMLPDDFKGFDEGFFEDGDDEDDDF